MVEAWFDGQEALYTVEHHDSYSQILTFLHTQIGGAIW